MMMSVRAEMSLRAYIIRIASFGFPTLGRFHLLVHPDQFVDFGFANVVKPGLLQALDGCEALFWV